MITEQIANVYDKIDSIPVDEEDLFVHFVLVGVLAIHHHHHIEETLICQFCAIRNFLQLVSPCYTQSRRWNPNSLARRCKSTPYFLIL